MQDREVKIEELRLRLHGTHAGEARGIGAEVVQRLSETLPASVRKAHIESLNLKVNISEGTSGTEMSKLIADAIIQGLV